MPAQTVFVIYNTTDGEILRAHTGKDDNPPTAPSGHAVHDAGQIHVPNKRTHKISLGPPVTLVVKSSGDMVSEAEAIRVAQIEMTLGQLDATREKMIHPSRGFDVTALDVQIAALEAERTDLLTP